jgi:medium-chain acyl-[acyl-carrier-protein] hydrolase
LVHLPGRESRLRERPLTSIREIANCLADEIGPSLDRSYAFYGHSLGATVAFETARRLEAQGARRPELLIVSASRAPHLAWPHPPVRHLPDLDLLHEINRRYDAVPSQVIHSKELQELLAPPLRADLTAIETYSYEPGAPFTFPIRVFGGSADVMVGCDALEAWRLHTAASFNLSFLEGDHFFIQSSKRELIRTVSGELLRYANRGRPEANDSRPEVSE